MVHNHSSVSSGSLTRSVSSLSAKISCLPSSPIEHPLVRVRMWLSEKLHERSSMFDNMESAVSGTLRFAEAMGAIVTQRAVLATSIRCSFSSSTSASHMASTAVRYLTLQRVDGSTQRSSVVVTDPLLCPPELDLYSSVPPFVFVCWGGIGASAPCLTAVPVVCNTTRLQLGFHYETGGCCFSTVLYSM